MNPKYWSHMFQKHGWYRETYESQWQKSADILETAIALPIMVRMSEERIAEIADKLMKISAEVI